MRLLFLRATGLGSIAAEPGQIPDIDFEEGQARVLIARGRAIPAPGEVAPEPHAAITTESLGLNSETPAVQRKKGTRT